jgi:hypothetical protein
VKLDLSDAFAVGGLVAFGVGMWLVDPRLSLIAVGILLYLAGTKG